MQDAMHIAATGMQTQQLFVNTIAHNISNMNTSAFKRERVVFSDMVAPKDIERTQLSADNNWAAMGTKLLVRAAALDSGEVRQTNRSLDIAIDGPGMLEVDLGGGLRGFTRGGSLRVNADGYLTTATGQPLLPGINIPQDADDLQITLDGRVMARLPNEKVAQEYGKLSLTRIASDDQIEPLGDGLYRLSDPAMNLQAFTPGEQGTGNTRQGYLEGSNVKMVDEFVNLMIAQRAYEANVKIIQASDEMLGLINTLRK